VAVVVAAAAAEMVQQRVEEVRELEAAAERQGLNLGDGQGVGAEHDFWQVEVEVESFVRGERAKEERVVQQPLELELELV
jgi:hypothetical protein